MSDPSSDFDWRTYVSNYFDLKGHDTEEKAKEHWLAYGQREGRTYKKLDSPVPAIPTDFDWQAYLENYQDLGAHGIDTEEKAGQHWLVYGRKEGRTYQRLKAMAQEPFSLKYSLAAMLYRIKKIFRRTKKIVVFTAIFGDTDFLKSPPAELLDPAIDFICYTDNRQLTSLVWQIKNVPLIDDNPILTSRYYKMLPHRHLKPYDFSLWLDASHTPTKNISNLVATFLANADLACFNHPERNCLYKEVEKCQELYLDDIEIIHRQITKYKKEGYPENNGLLVGAILLRRHRQPAVIKTMEDWWEEFRNNSWRDQISFNYVVHKNQLKFAVIPGDYRKNPYFKFSPHLKLNIPGEIRLGLKTGKTAGFERGQAFKLYDLLAFSLKRLFNKKKPGIGWLLFGDENTASSRMQGINIHDYLKSRPLDSVVIYKPKVCSPQLVLNRFAQWLILHAGLDVLIFQKTDLGAAREMAGKCRKKNIKTVFLLADMPGKPEKSLLDVCDYFIVVSKYLKNSLISYGVEPARITVIEDAIEIPPSLGKDYSDAGNKSLVKVIWVGASNQLVNLSIVKEALGDSSLTDFRLITLTRENPRTSWNLPAVWAKILQCDVAVIPFDLKTTSYLMKSANRLTMFKSLGLPVICTPIPAYQEIIVDGQNGFFAETKADWSRCFKLLKDSQTRKKIGLADREKILSLYNLDTIGDKYFKLLANLKS